MWALDPYDGKVYAYKTADESRDTDKGFDLHPDNDDPKGMWGDGETMYVTDLTDDKLYLYSIVGVNTLVKNTGQALLTNAANLRTATPALAVSFTTGSDSAGYEPDYYGFRFGSSVPGSSDFTVTLNEDDGGEPSMVVCTLINPASYAADAVNTFTAPGACGTLTVSTTYFVVMTRGPPPPGRWPT